MESKEEDIIFKEAIKIIDSNKQKASTLRYSILNLNQNIYTNNLNIQIIQFLGELEYDLKTLIELMNDFKNKTQNNYKNNVNTLKKELNTITKENFSLKELLEETSLNKNEQLQNKKKYGLNKRNTFQNTKLKNFKKKDINNKTYKNIKKKDNTERSNNSEIRPFRKENFSQKNFYTNKMNIPNKNNNNVDNKQIFYDYNTFLSNLKKNKNVNFIKYDNFKHNNKKGLREIARGGMNNSVRAKSTNSKIIYKNNNFVDEEKKQKIINEIFQNEKILKALKKKYGNEIEDKLLNEDISYEFLIQVDEIADKIRNCYYNTPRNKKEQTMNGINISYNLKIPKRYSNSKNDNSLSNLIIT